MPPRRRWQSARAQPRVRLPRVLPCLATRLVNNGSTHVTAHGPDSKGGMPLLQRPRSAKARRLFKSKRRKKICLSVRCSKLLLEKRKSRGSSSEILDRAPPLLTNPNGPASQPPVHPDRGAVAADFNRCFTTAAQWNSRRRVNAGPWLDEWFQENCTSRGDGSLWEF